MGWQKLPPQHSLALELQQILITLRVSDHCPELPLGRRGLSDGEAIMRDVPLDS